MSLKPSHDLHSFPKRKNSIGSDKYFEKKEKNVMQYNEKKLFHVPVLRTCYLFLGNCHGLWRCSYKDGIYIGKLLFLNLIFSTTHNTSLLC